MSNTTPGGIEFDYWKGNAATPHFAFVVLVISGEYSGITWITECVVATLDDAMTWIDSHPLSTGGLCPDRYEVQRAECVGIALR